MKKLITTIIPVYNNEKYIKECVESLVGDDEYNKINKIIIVNDGSTDKTEDEIIDLIVTYNDTINIKYYWNETNLGTSASRNKGLELVDTKYVHFVDGDDLVNPSVLNKMVQSLENEGGNWCCCQHKRYKNDTIIHNWASFNSTINMPNNIIRGDILDYPNLFFVPFIWNKIIRTDFLTDNGLKFRRNCIGEDVDFTTRLQYLSPKFNYINEIGYYYRSNNRSVTHSKTINDIDSVNFEVLLPLLTSEKCSDKHNLYLSLGMFWFMPYQYTITTEYNHFKEVFKVFKKFLTDEVMNILPPTHQSFYKGIMNEDKNKYYAFRNLIKED